MKILTPTLKVVTLIILVVGATQAAADIAPGFSDDDSTTVSRIAELREYISEKELRDGSYSTSLYAPIRELGLLQQAAGDHAAAVDSFRRMQHLVHRTYGVFDPRQIESLNYILDSFYRQGHALNIDQQEHFRFHIIDKAYPSDSEEHRSGRLQLADWYRNSGRLQKASNLYTELLETAPDDAALKLRVLRAEALTRYLAGRCCASEPLYQALLLMDEQPDGRLELSQALVDYMDMAVMESVDVQVTRSDLEPAFLGFTRSKQVLALMNTSTPLDPFSETYVDFGERGKDAPPVPTVGSPVAMCGTTYDTLVSDKSSPEFEVSVELDDTGHPQRVSVEGDGPLKLKRYLRKSLKSGKFRPATSAEGEFVAATLSFRQTFGDDQLAVDSQSTVPAWGRMLVSQTCQVSGIQRI